MFVIWCWVVWVICVFSLLLSLYQIWFEIISSIMWVVLSFSLISLFALSFIVWCGPTCWFFYFVVCALGVIPPKICRQDQHLPWFLRSFCKIRDYVFTSLIHFEFIFGRWYKIGIQFHFSTCLVISLPFIEETIL